MDRQTEKKKTHMDSNLSENVGQKYRNFRVNSAKIQICPLLTQFSISQWRNTLVSFCDSNVWLESVRIKGRISQTSSLIAILSSDSQAPKQNIVQLPKDWKVFTSFERGYRIDNLTKFSFLKYEYIFSFVNFTTWGNCQFFSKRKLL